MWLLLRFQVPDLARVLWCSEPRVLGVVDEAWFNSKHCFIPQVLSNARS